MFNQVIMGKPKKCLNRNCKAKFFKESFLGYMPKNETEVYTVMKCPVCNDTFAIVQMYAIVKEYIDELPTKPRTNKPKAVPITIDEVQKIKQAMEEQNVLQALADEKYNKLD